jgi:PilZ domain
MGETPVLQNIWSNAIGLFNAASVTCMSEKPEPRLDVELPIRIFGMSAEGRPFLQNARARNISRHGAKLAGLETRLKPGEVVGVQLGEKKARCKVIWVVDAGQTQKVEVGVSLLEGQPCPWEKEMEQSQQAEEPATRIAPSDVEKRKFPRHRVPFPIEIRDENAVGSQMKTKSADISGRGFYIETLMPLPVGKVLQITFWIGEERVRTPAIVRSCDGGVGMGIEFTELDDETRNRLQHRIEAMVEESDGSKKTESPD